MPRFPIHLVAGPGDAPDVSQDPDVWAEVESALVMQRCPNLETFQFRAGLEVTGFLDPETLDALGVVIR